MEGKITRRISGVFSSQSNRVKDMIRDINDNPHHPSLVKRSVDDRKKVKEEREKVEGYLQKLGEKGIVKGWKTRWFVLDQNILSYYRERSDPTPISFILLQTVKSVYVSNSMEINHKGFDFVLNTDGRDYILSAGSDEDRMKWVQAIDRAREEACKPIVSSITKHNAAVAAGTATTQPTPTSSTLTLSSKPTPTASSTSTSSSTPTSTSPPKTSSSSSSSAVPTKGFARSGGRNNSAARAGIRMSDSRTLQKELQKLENPAAYFDEDGAERTGLAIGAGRRGKSSSLAPPPKGLMTEEEEGASDEEIRTMREKYKKEEQEELELEAAKKLEEQEKLRKQQEEQAERQQMIKREEDQRIKREEEEAKREEERLNLEHEETKRLESANQVKREDMAQREKDEELQKPDQEDNSNVDKVHADEHKKEERTNPIKPNGRDTQDSHAALSSSPCSLSLSSSASSSPSATPGQSPDSSPTPIKRTDRQNSFTRAASMSSLPNGSTAVAEPAPAALLKPPAQRKFDNVSPLTSDDERDQASVVNKGDIQPSAQPAIPSAGDPRESPRKVEVKHEEKKSPKKSPRAVQSDSPQEAEPEIETSYVRKKIVFRKSVMPQQPPISTSPMLAPGSISNTPAEHMGFGYNSFSGMPSEYGGQYPYASNTAKIAARASLSTSLESVKNRFTVNAEGYMQVTSGTELRTIIGRAIASNGQSTLPGIQVGPFFFDFENGVWKLNIQKGSNEIGPRSESKEEYLESLREKKQKAIEDEDYNLASFYKHKEQSALTMESEIFVLPGGIVLCYRNSKWEITECPSQPGLSYIAATPKKQEAPPPSINTLASSLFNPLQSLQLLLDNVVQVDPEDEEAVALLTQLEEAVSIIVVHFKDTTAPTPTVAPPPTPNAPNFSQVLVSNLTRSTSPNPPSITHNNSTNSHTNVNSNFTYNTNVTRNNLYSSSLSSSSTSNTISSSSFLTADGPYTINNNATYRANASPTPNRTRQNEPKSNNPAAAIAAAAAATNAKKLNALVRGKFCTALAGVLANGLRKQLHILSLQEPHMWDFMEECGTWPKHADLMGLSLGQTMKTINSAMQDPNMKYRSLICEALNTKSLRDWLQLMMSYDTLTEKYFEDFALIRHHAVFQKYIDCIARLNDLPFELDVMYEAKMQRQHAAHEPAQQTQAQQPAQVLANIGSLFSSFLAAPKSAQDNQNGDGNSTEEKPKGLFGFKNVFNM